ncbi:MAG: hypothetical protein D6692_12095 [Planctomycetota bacterium]|nr:MAG: hypothetical protein D6692_12095 [Planctomycetota bacterium]
MRYDRIAALAGIAAASLAHADEIVLKNDSLVDGGSVNVCPCFVQNEEAAVWLTSPCDGEIVAIQIFWKSFFGGADQVIEDSILVYEGGTFPNPGPLKEELLAPLLTDGGLNEFRYMDDQQTIPISIPVQAGETFVVSLKFFNSNANDVFAPSIVSDDSGCQPGKNAVKVNGNQWRNACSLGVSGDWVIRAIVNCGGEPTGAVCLPDGTCADGLTESDAIALGGVWNGAGSTCGSVTCLGACYIPSTGGCLQFDKATCDAVGGDWQGPGTTDCNPCPADLAEPFGTLNIFDLQAYVGLYNAQDPSADLAAPFGSYNIFDIQAYIGLYNKGCP